MFRCNINHTNIKNAFRKPGILWPVLKEISLKNYHYWGKGSVLTAYIIESFQKFLFSTLFESLPLMREVICKYSYSKSTGNDTDYIQLYYTQCTEQYSELHYITKSVLDTHTIELVPFVFNAYLFQVILDDIPPLPKQECKISASFHVKM